MQLTRDDIGHLELWQQGALLAEEAYQCNDAWQAELWLRLSHNATPTLRSGVHAKMQKLADKIAADPDFQKEGEILNDFADLTEQLRRM